MEKPSIVLVPGAWHSANTYNLVVSLLKEEGYECLALTLPSVGAEPPVKNLDPDIKHVREAIQPLLDAGKDVVVVMHSYAGVAGSSSLRGFAKHDREEQGLRGGVTALVYLTAWMVPEGKSVRDGGGGKGGKGGPGRVREDGDYIHHLKPIEAFYNDVDPEMAQHHAASLPHHSLPTLLAPQQYAAFKHIPTTYLLCTADETIPIDTQEKLVEHAGVPITQFTCSAGHSPMLSQPALTTQVIRHAAGEDIQVELQ